MGIFLREGIQLNDVFEELAKAREEEGYTIGVQPFIYGWPLIEMYRSRWEWHFDKSSHNYNGPINVFGHTRRATHEDTFVVTPINDAFYSRAFVDLVAEPVIFEPPVIDDRYYTAQMVDFYTNSFDYVGVRKGDTDGGAIALVGPDWRGVLPEGINRVIHSPTPVKCILARVVPIGNDEDSAIAIQHQFKLTPLTVWSSEAEVGPVVPPPRPYLDFEKSDPLDFYRVLN